MTYTRGCKAVALPAAAGLMLLLGCGTVRLEVPPGHGSVRLLHMDESAQIKVQRTIWFWMWGAKPISDNTTKPDIEKYDLDEVRLTTKQTVLDNVLNSIIGIFSFARRTLVVEGNPREATPPETVPPGTVPGEQP